ncbi:MAG: 6,7-dimethyl-8-ribityllumazine synthase [Bdellovibrionota bacterium]
MKIINEQNSKPSPFPIAVVVSRFNEEITQLLLSGALARLQEFQFSEELVTVVWVPGAVEIPLTTQHLAQSKKFQAIVCLGAVVRGETTHYDYVCQQVSQGCQKVGLENNIPVIFGVLTTENEEQAFARVGGTHGHKGCDAVDTACEMVSLLKSL